MEPKIIDFDWVNDWLDGDQELIQETLEIYQEEILSYVDHLGEALATQDYDRLFFMLHKMSSPILLFRMTDANQCIKEVEAQKLNEVKDVLLIQNQLQLLESILRKSLTEVNEYLRQKA